MKNSIVGSILVALALTTGCAKSATVRPDERSEAPPPADASSTKDAEKVAERPASRSEEKPRETQDASDKLGASTVYFDYDSDNLTAAAREQLAQFVEQVKTQGVKASFVLEGHADERGTEEYNLALGDRRANAVRRYLEKLGVSGKQMRVVSYGENKPSVQGSSESAWSRNRRVEIVPPQMTSSLK